MVNPIGAISVKVTKHALKEGFALAFMKDFGIKCINSILLNVKSEEAHALFKEIDTIAGGKYEFSKLLKTYPVVMVSDYIKGVCFADKSLNEDVEHALIIDRAFENENNSSSKDMGYILAFDFLVNNFVRCNLLSDEASAMGDPSSIFIINNSHLVTFQNCDFEEECSEHLANEMNDFLIDLKNNERTSNSLFAKRVKHYILTYTGHELSEYRTLQLQDAFIAKLIDFASKNMKEVVEDIWKRVCQEANHAEAIDFKFIKKISTIIHEHYH